MVKSSKRKIIVAVIIAAVLSLAMAIASAFGLNVNSNPVEAATPANADSWVAINEQPTYAKKHGEAATVIDMGDGYRKLDGVLGWGNTIRSSAVPISSEFKFKFNLAGLTELGQRFGVSFLNEQTKYGPAEGNCLNVVLFAQGSNQMRIYFGKNHDFGGSGTIAYFDSDTGKNYNIGGCIDGSEGWNCFVFNLPDGQQPASSNMEFSLNFVHDDANARYKCTLKVLGGNNLRYLNYSDPAAGEKSQRKLHETFYIDDTYMNNSLVNGSTYLSYFNCGSSNAGLQLCVNKISSSYDQATGFTTVKNLSVYNDRAYLNRKVKLDGLKMSFKTNTVEMGRAGMTYEEMIGVGFVKNGTDFSTQTNTFNLDIWTRSALNQVSVVTSKSHDYHENCNIAFRETDLFGMANALLGADYKRLDKYSGTDGSYEHIIGAPENGYYGMTVTFNYVQERNLWKLTYEYIGTKASGFNAVSYVSDAYFRSAMDAEGKAYVSVYGFVGTNHAGFMMSASIKLEEGYTVSINTATGTTKYNVAKNAKFALPNLGNVDNKILIGYNIDGNLYKIGDEITVEKDSNVVAQYLDFKLSNGASVLKNGLFGIRFESVVTKDQTFDTWSSSIENVGMIIMPTDLIKYNTDFTYEKYPSTDNGGVANFVTSDFTFKEDKLNINGAIYDLNLSNYNRPFSARVYVTVKYGSSSGIRVYGNYLSTDNSRSIYTVAARALNKGEEDKTGQIKKYVESIPNVNCTKGNFELVSAIKNSLVKSIDSTSKIVGKTVTLVLHVTNEYETLLDKKFEGIIFNSRRVKIISQTSVAEDGGFKVTLTFNQPNGLIDTDFVNFWTGDTVYNEPILLTAEGDADLSLVEGNYSFISNPKAKLLYNATKIESVVWNMPVFGQDYKNKVSAYESGSYDVSSLANMSDLTPVYFKEGENFTYENGYIIAKGDQASNFMYETYRYFWYTPAGNDNYAYNPSTGKWEGQFYGSITSGHDKMPTWNGMPFVSDTQIMGTDSWPGMGFGSATDSSSAHMKSIDLVGRDFVGASTSGNYNLPFSEGREIFQMQLLVTYKHSEGTWNENTVKWAANYDQGSKLLSKFQGDKALARSYTKLSTKTLGDGRQFTGRDTNNWDSNNSFNVFAIGDSITAGCNTTQSVRMSPNTDKWACTFTDNLARYYNLEFGEQHKYFADIQLRDFAIGGWVSSQGLNGDGTNAGMTAMLNIAGNPWVRGVKGWTIDLAIIAFGMNDATGHVMPAQFKANIKGIMDAIRSANPNCDFILVSPMNANIYNDRYYFVQSQYYDVLKELADADGHSALIDMSVIQNALMDSGKKYMEISGNGTNHTNDFMSRAYAMELLGTLIDDPRMLSVKL